MVADWLDCMLFRYLKLACLFVHNVGRPTLTVNCRLASQTIELKRIMEEIYKDVCKINKILERWETNTGPGGLQFRFRNVGQAVFALGSSPDELKKLSDSLDRRKGEVTAQMTLMLGLGWNAQVPNANRPVSPSSMQDVSIIFVDKDNESKSMSVLSFPGVALRKCCRSISGVTGVCIAHP